MAELARLLEASHDECAALKEGRTELERALVRLSATARTSVLSQHGAATGGKGAAGGGNVPRAGGGGGGGGGGGEAPLPRRLPALTSSSSARDVSKEEPQRGAGSGAKQKQLKL